MRSFPEYDYFDALGLAELVRDKDISPAEICEEAIRRIESINPRINAVILEMFDMAKKTAGRKSQEGPFAGVPFLSKDTITSYAGIPLTMENNACVNHSTTLDNELMKRYKATGILIMGKTNTPESCLLAYNSPDFYGPTRNPWNLDHEPGGSCGASAAAVASGMVPMASSGDAGGSLRIPSSCCGLFGFKPTRGRTPTGPHHGEVWQGAYSEHVITRSVRDSAAMLDAVNGADPGAPYVIPAPERPYLEEMEREALPLRIAFTKKSPLNTSVHPECQKAVEHAANLLMGLGHHVEEAEPDIDGTALAKSFFMLCFGETAADISELKTTLGRKPVASDLEEAAWVFKLLGDVYSAGEFVLAMRMWNKITRQMGLFYQKYDLYLTPTLAFPPAKIGETKSKPLEKLLMKIIGQFCKGKFMMISDAIDELVIECMAKNPFTQIANIAGLPAMSVPLHWTMDGLPCGVQFIGRFGDEATLYRLASQIEKAQPWFHKRPMFTRHVEPLEVINGRFDCP